jgi:hypothetical protein
VTVSSIATLSEACGILFGPEVRVTFDFLKYLQPEGIKAAYWKKALETHPDRAKALGVDERKMSERFREVNIAYERLKYAIRGDGIVVLGNASNGPGDKNTPPTRHRTRKRHPREKARQESHKGKKYQEFKDHFYAGFFPKRELLIGQFLYYSGIVSWRTLIKAILWQRRQRPLIGQLAKEWGMLNQDEIREILMGRQARENFGECALRKGYLNTFKIMALLGKQRKFELPIGKYFVNKGLILSGDIDLMVEKQRIHNMNAFSHPWR